MEPRFVTSAARPDGFPPDRGAEVAVVGRSNSGKSSAINRITGMRKLARVSKTPGRTQLINFFELPGGGRLVDLPGYGFARVPEAVRLRWEALISAYFGQRRSLAGLIVTVDVRRGFRSLDLDMFAWAAELGIPVLVLATKADKLSRGAALGELERLRRAAPAHVEPVLFSATTGVGADTARQRLAEWLDRSGRAAADGQDTAAPERRSPRSFRAPRRGSWRNSRDEK